MEKTYKVDHIGFVSRDVEKTAEMLSNYLGIKDWRILTIEPPILCEIVLHGKKVSHSFKIAFARLGVIALEFLMPIEGDSVYSEFLKEGKQGFHHICLVFSSEAELKEERKKLIKRGGKLIQSGRIKERSFYCYIEKEGIVLELLFRE